jgi:hypothetical protein
LQWRWHARFIAQPLAKRSDRLPLPVPVTILLLLVLLAMSCAAAAAAASAAAHVCELCPELLCHIITVVVPASGTRIAPAWF